MCKKCVLFADNTPEFLITRSEFLEKIGYSVLKAFTLEEARHYLAEANVHLAILDIRMVDDDDEKDISGLLLAKDPSFQSVPKIILTGFPTVATVKEALGPALKGLPPAVDFIMKADGATAMIEAVERSFNHFVPINWALEIQWDARETLSFPYLANLLQAHLPSDVLIHRANELEDLVRKLFFDYQRILLGGLLWRDQHQFCLPVVTQSSDGTTDLRILVCGERELIRQHQDHIEKFAPNVLQRTELRNKSETTHFGANLYELRGVNMEALQTLRDLFQTGRERSLKTAFTHLLGDVLKAWHDHGQEIGETHDLLSAYRDWAGLAEGFISRTEVEQRVESLIQSLRTLEGVRIERSDGQLTFHFAHQQTEDFPDPVAAIYGKLSQHTAPMICRLSPGRITADNILVDSKLKTWLTDFEHADQAPQWWDFVCLEASIRFDLSRAPDLLAWQTFERCLMKPARLDEGLEEKEVDTAELRTSVALIEQIRQQAASETGPEVAPYFAGLLAWVVRAMIDHRPGVLWAADRLRGVHLLLAACMLAKQLDTPLDASPSGGLLRLDENGRVWLGEQKVAALVGLRLKLLQYLFEQEGQVANNLTITENVYGETYNARSEDQNQRIRQEISRLREDIEPDPSRPRYILTERGRGYRLKATGEPEE